MKQQEKAGSLYPVGGGFSVRFSVTSTDYGLYEPECEWHPYDPGPAKHHMVDWGLYMLACQKFYQTLSEADQRSLGVVQPGDEGAPQ